MVKNTLKATYHSVNTDWDGTIQIERLLRFSNRGYTEGLNYAKDWFQYHIGHDSKLSDEEYYKQYDGPKARILRDAPLAFVIYSANLGVALLLKKNHQTNLNFKALKTSFIKSIFIITFIFINTSIFAQTKIDVEKEMQDATLQYQGILKTHQDITKFPQSYSHDGKIMDRSADWWCSGFFGGSLWYLFDYTKETKWRNEANKWTMAVEKEKNNTSTHDLGFMLYCSFGNGYRLTHDIAYKSVLLKGAASLASRYNPKYRVIKSWDEWKGFDYPVIIDNMMNLEFLLWAAKASGDKNIYNIAISHADNTIKNHFRKDYSSYHVACYGKDSKVLKQGTHQGYSDSSAWSRGQGWGLYGYTVMYRETGNRKYLEQAEHIGQYILNHPNLPEDKIPYWDFNDPAIPNTERDVSAAAVISSALFELSQYSKKNSEEYLKAATAMLSSMTSPKYKAALGTNGNFLLTHSVGSKPHQSEVDVPLVYADYYYLEALLRYDQLTKTGKLNLKQD